MPLNAWQEFMSLSRGARGTSGVSPFAKPPYEDPNQENQFKSWYSTHADRWGLDPDPDNPLHQYDYRAAYEAGVGPSAEHDGHWPSEFKLAAHPNRFVDGKDTITGEPAAAPRKNAWEEFQELAGAKPKPDFYDLPQAQSMRASGGILPEDVDVERANRELRETDPILRLSAGAAKGFNKAPGVAFTRSMLSSGAGLAGGIASMAGEATGLLPESLLQHSKVTPKTFATLADVLSAAAHDLQPEEDRAPWMQRLLSDPARYVVTTTGQAAPYMLAGMVPGGVSAMTTGIMGQEVQRLEGEGAEPGLGRLAAGVGSGAAQSLLERIPMARAVAGFAGTPLKRALRGAAWEVPTEILQVVPSTLADLSLGLREGESWGEILSKTGHEMVESGMAAIAPGMFMGAGSPNKIHEPASLLEKSLDWLAKRQARRDLAALPEQQAEADRARVDRKRREASGQQSIVPEAQQRGPVTLADTTDSLVTELDEMVAEMERDQPDAPGVQDLRKQLDELKGAGSAETYKGWRIGPHPLGSGMRLLYEPDGTEYVGVKVGQEREAIDSAIESRRPEADPGGRWSAVPQQILMKARERGFAMPAGDLSEPEQRMLADAGIFPEDGEYVVEPFDAEMKRRKADGTLAPGMSIYDTSHLPTAEEKDPIAAAREYQRQYAERKKKAVPFPSDRAGVGGRTLDVLQLRDKSDDALDDLHDELTAAAQGGESGEVFQGALDAVTNEIRRRGHTLPGAALEEEVPEREAFSDVPSEEEMAEFERLLDEGVEPEAALEAVEAIAETKPKKKRETRKEKAERLAGLDKLLTELETEHAAKEAAKTPEMRAAEEEAKRVEDEKWKVRSAELREEALKDPSSAASFKQRHRESKERFAQAAARAEAKEAAAVVDPPRPAAKLKVTVPEKFLEDHLSRETQEEGAITLLTRGGGRVTIEATEAGLAELLSDAEHYADRNGPAFSGGMDEAGRPLGRSAERTVAALKKAQEAAAAPEAKAEPVVLNGLGKPYVPGAASAAYEASTAAGRLRKNRGQKVDRRTGGGGTAEQRGQFKAAAPPTQNKDLPGRRYAGSHYYITHDNSMGESRWSLMADGQQLGPPSTDYAKVLADLNEVAPASPPPAKGAATAPPKKGKKGFTEQVKEVTQEGMYSEYAFAFDSPSAEPAGSSQSSNWLASEIDIGGRGAGGFRPMLRDSGVWTNGHMLLVLSEKEKARVLAKYPNLPEGDGGYKTDLAAKELARPTSPEPLRKVGQRAATVVKMTTDPKRRNESAAMVLYQQPSGEYVALDADYDATLKARYPDAVPYTTATKPADIEGKVVIFKVGDVPVGGIMPMRMGDSGATFRADLSPEHKQVFEEHQAQLAQEAAAAKEARAAARAAAADRKAAKAARERPGEAGYARNPAELLDPEKREKLRLWRKLMFRANKGLDSALAEPRRKWIARMDAAMLQLEEGHKELARIIEGHDYSQGGIKSEKQLVRFLDDAFRGLVAVHGRTTESGRYIPSTLEKHAPEAVAVMDRLISQRDTLARDLRKRSKEGGSGITSEIALELERSFGLYVHRTYQAKFDEGWQAKLKREHPASFAAGMDMWTRQALEPAIKKLMSVNPDLSNDAARTQVMSAWEARWAAQKIDPDTRRIKLPIVGQVAVTAEDVNNMALGSTLYTVGQDKGTLTYFDEASGMVTIDTGPNNMGLYDVPLADVRQRVRQSIVVDNPKQVEGSYLAALRWSNRGGSMLPGAALEAGKNLNVRKQRDRSKPDWERALLGEVRDVRTNYMGTMAQMVHLAETDRFLHEIAKAGKEIGVFFPKAEGESTERIDPDLFGLGRVEGIEQAAIAKELIEKQGANLPPEVLTGLQEIVDGVKGGPAYHPRTSPLGELFATKDIAEALRNEVKGPQGNISKIAYGAAAMAKANLTVFSLQSSMRNYHSNAFYLMANGWNPFAIYGIYDRVGKGVNARKVSYARVANDLFNLGLDARQGASESTGGLIDKAVKNPKLVDKWLTDKLAEYVRLGIAHQSTTVGDLHRLTRQTYKMLRNQDKPGLLTHIGKTAQDMYVAHDDFAKILAYERELATMKEAYPNLQALGMQPAQVAQEMANLEKEGALKPWRGLMMQGARQHYGEQILLNRNLSEQAALKVRRTMQNYQELPEFWKMLSANPIMAPFSAFRFSLVRNAVNIGRLGWEEFQSDNPVIKKRGAQRLAGMVFTALFPLAWGKALQLKSETDDDELDALREVGYPWSANASLGIYSNENGEVVYFDGGHIDVWDDLREPVYAALRNGDFGDAFKRAAYSAWQNFVPIDEEIALSALMDIRRNRKKTGGDIYLDSDGWINRSWKIAKHGAISGALPATLRSAQKVYYGATGQQDPGGRDYKLWQETIALGGPRFVTLNLKDRLDDHAKEFQHAQRSSGDQIKVHRLGDIEGGAAKARKSSEVDVSQFLDKVRAYRTLGLTEREIQDVITDAGMSPGLAMAFSRLDKPSIMRNLNSKLDVRQRKLTTELSGGPSRGSSGPSRGNRRRF